MTVTTLFEVFEVCLETTLGVLRTLVSHLPLVFLFIFTLAIWYTVSQHNAKVVFAVDALYESVRPNVVELFLQVLNFTRVVFALLVGVWNAIIDISLIPIRLIFNAGFECGGPEFVQNVALKGSFVMTEVANVLVGFASGFANDNAIDVEITALSARVREFSLVFMQVVESVRAELLMVRFCVLWRPHYTRPRRMSSPTAL